MNEIQVVKIIIVGDANVGKTSLLMQFCSNQFNLHQSPTIGCDYSYKIIKRDGIQLKLHLWDVAGQEKFQNLSKLFVREAKGCIVVSDITSKLSLDHAVQWKNLVQDQEEVPIFLIQNKTDLLGSHMEQYQTLEYLKKFANDNNFTNHYQLSVKEDQDQIDLLFYDLVSAMIDSGTLKLQEAVIKSSFHLSSDSGKKKEKKECC